MTSYPTFFRKYTSAEPVFIKIGKIVHFDDTRSQKKIQNDSDIFDAVMTSQFLTYKMRMGDPIEINLVSLDFSFKDLSNQTKKLIGQK